MRTKTVTRASALVLVLCSLAAVAAAQDIPTTARTITTAGANCGVATNCSSFSTDGLASFGIDLDVGVSGTFQFEIQVDPVTDTAWRAWPDAVNGASSATADGYYTFSNTGFRRFRVRASAISGAATLSVARGFVPLRSTASLTSSGGDASAANQTTIIGHVDGLEGLLGTSNTNTGAAATSLGIIDNIVFGAGLEAPALRVTLPTDGTGVVGLTGSALDKLTSIDNTMGSLLGRVNPDQVEDTPPVFLSGPFGMGKALDFTGSAAIRSAVSADNDPVIPSITRFGVPYQFLVNEDGSKELGKREDDPHTTLDYGLPMWGVRADTAASTGANGDYVAVISDSVGAAWTRSTGELPDDGGFTAGTSRVFPGGFVADEASIDSVNEDDIGAARMTLDRLLYSVPAASTSSTQAAVGCYLVSAASTNSTNCKNTPGNFYGLRAVNTTTTTYYLRLYNTSAAPTCSSATGFVESIPIPPAAAAGGAGGIVSFLPMPINYATGFSYCFTGGASSTDNTNAATGVYAALYYK